jgi:hypothetical protein
LIGDGWGAPPLLAAIVMRSSAPTGSLKEIALVEVGLAPHV